MAQDPQGKSPLAAYVPKPFQGIIGAAVVHDDHLIAHAAIETSLKLAEQAGDIGGLVIDGDHHRKLIERLAQRRCEGEEGLVCAQESNAARAGGWNPWNAIVGSFL